MPVRELELSTVELRSFIDPNTLPEDSIPAPEGGADRVVGQRRAVDAIKFGMGMKKPGYNIFIAGPSNAGLMFISRTFIENQAGKEKVPPDWCYVYNFKEKDRPASLQLRPGRGRDLKQKMNEFIRTLQRKIPEVFESEDYQVKEGQIHKTFEQQRQDLMEQLSQEAKNHGFIIQFSQVGLVIVPVNQMGQPMSQAEIHLLSEADSAEMKAKSTYLQERAKATLKKIQNAEGELKELRSKLDNQIALFVVGQLMEDLEEAFSDEPQVLDYLTQVQEDILSNIDDFKSKPEMPQQPPMGPGQMMPQAQGSEMAMRRYEVNVLIDNSETTGAPVVIESNPAYGNIFGSIEKQAWFGALITDHTMIKPGALHRANGGYLVMKALDLLRMNMSYEALQRAIRDREIKIEDAGDLYGMFGTRSLRPEPIPLNLKIILAGDPEIYHILYTNDDRFRKHFKVKAHLDDRIERGDETIAESVRMMKRYCKEHELRTPDRTGIARVLEYSLERTEDREKLTLELGKIGDLLMEADYFADLDGAESISKKHVEEALKKRIYRSNLVEERVKEYIEKDIMWVETDGYKVGQVNGLSVLMVGDHEFGKPNRITATVSVGREGTVSIDRESKMSGNIHTKGLLTHSSFLKERFAQNKPLSLTASLAFEQSYGMIDGDSASSTELYVLLSAIGQVPIYQGIAVTGSVSQKGEIQPIGGVNYKVKGFYDICKAKGLTGKQGVLIPSKNVRNLMLDQEIIDAVNERKFHIWAVSTIEEGIEILTGVKAGVLQEDGTYPEGTVFRKVDDRLKELGEIVRKYGKETDEGKKPEDDSPGGCPHCGV